MTPLFISPSCQALAEDRNARSNSKICEGSGKQLDRTSCYVFGNGFGSNCYATNKNEALFC